MLGDSYATEATAVRAPSDARPGVERRRRRSYRTIRYSNQYWHWAISSAHSPARDDDDGSSMASVAVVDQGVRFDHPSMAANFTNDGYNFVAAGNRLASPVDERRQGLERLRLKRDRARTRRCRMTLPESRTVARCATPSATTGFTSRARSARRATTAARPGLNLVGEHLPVRARRDR